MAGNDHAREDADDLSNPVIGVAIEVHRLLGLGLLESPYAGCLCQELTLRGIPFEC
jgi:GxxExxY protein